MSNLGHSDGRNAWSDPFVFFLAGRSGRPLARLVIALLRLSWAAFSWGLIRRASLKAKIARS